MARKHRTAAPRGRPGDAAHMVLMRAALAAKRARDTERATQAQDGGLPATPGKLPGTPRRRRPNMARPGNANQWTPEQAREMGKKGGRPKGSITQAYRTVYELAQRILTDPDVQDQMLQQARAGTLHPSTMRDLMYIYGGRPAYKMDVPRVADPHDEDSKRERLRRMDPDKRRQMLDFFRELDPPRALPARPTGTVP